MKQFKTALVLTVSFLCIGMKTEKQSIYHKDWIDFNKNGVKDVFEDQNANIDERVSNLISLMNVEEKTCQLTTLYGYARVLKDELPTPEWKNRVWKDGIANIDEHLNTIWNQEKTHTELSFPYSTHAEAINKVQKWFIEETRMGIPVDFTK